ncbi:MAG: CPBP family intramembrane metalloprotease [Candidatus Lokiarchaeota archaeon]|nr:CPBP family intramembrane metalloprotease [Candidatus Lokiarchaeota archaeon]
MSEKSLLSLKNPLLQYFFLAIGITWLFWIPTLIISTLNNYFMPSILTFNQLISEGFVDNLHVLIFILNQVGVYGPFIAAVIIIAMTKKKEGLIDLLRRMGKVKIPIKWYGIIIVLPLAIFFFSALLSFVDLTQLFNLGMSGFLVFLMFLNTTLTSGLEEPGWRGYALPTLQEKFNANKSSIILGFVWAIWHYPYLLYLYLTQLNFGLYLSILSIIGFTASIIGVSIIYTWIYNNTKSVFITIIFHGLLNFIPQVMFGGVTDNAGGVITALITWAIAIILTRKFGEETLVNLTEEEKRLRAGKKEKN